MKRWSESRKFCSVSCSKKGNTFRRGKSHPGVWNKGKKGLQVAWNKGNGDYAKALGFGKWMIGKEASVETRKKLSIAMKKRVAEGKHNFYIDGRTPQNKLIRHSLNYKLWREAVFARDDFTCTECNKRGVYLEAHHIKPFAFFPELRFAIDNGVTVCSVCHGEIDNYRARTLTRLP